MRKVIFLFLSLLFVEVGFGQQNYPTINANSNKVDIRVGADYFLKGGWLLEPSKNPDVFNIGSKWLYETKKVCFITDVDSITFDVEPGHKYDFIVLLNEKIPCNIQVVTMANPVFMSLPIISLIVVAFIAIFFIGYLLRKKVSSKALLKFGYVAPVLFWLMTIISGTIHGNYNHLRNVISELGAIGTKSELLTSSSLLIIATASILFSIGFYRISKEKHISVIPAVLSFANPITMTWASIFTLGNEFHGAMGPLPFLVMIGSLLTYILWRKNDELLTVRRLSLISFVIMMLILTRFIKPFGITHEGLTQRFFYLGWTIWNISVTYYLSKDLKRSQT